LLVDVHTHLTHEKFAHDMDDVVARAEAAGVGALVCNGLDPQSNRQILDLSRKYSIVWPSLGIYPLDAINDILPADFTLDVVRFDVNEEIAFIRQMAAENKIIAIGEIGLDGHWVGEDTFAAQERVFIQLLEIAMEFDLPAIIHTRKLEKRAIEILTHHGVKRVDFHCYGGKFQPAMRAATDHGWYFSIPANARVSQNSAKLLKELPLERVLTETDAPFLSPVRGERNETANVKGTVEFLAELRGMDYETAKQTIFDNFNRLFRRQKRDLSPA
jgi:TatD DNase family protein